MLRRLSNRLAMLYDDCCSVHAVMKRGTTYHHFPRNSLPHSLWLRTALGTTDEKKKKKLKLRVRPESLNGGAGQWRPKIITHRCRYIIRTLAFYRSRHRTLQNEASTKMRRRRDGGEATETRQGGPTDAFSQRLPNFFLGRRDERDPKIAFHFATAH